MIRLLRAWGLALVFLIPPVSAQVIEFENHGQKYQTLTKSGVTIIYTHLPMRLHEYAVVQVAVTNGSDAPYIVRPEDFNYIRSYNPIRAVDATAVIQMLMQKGSGSDVVKLISVYEASVYGNTHYKATNGFEQRRQAALAFGGAKLKAAATASALALGITKLAAGESSDGAVFFASEGKPLIGGRLVVRTNTDVFEFNAE
ncbi:MAG TPA: hypothetical protein VHW24_19450 [Bryobacteraceae bacterium]|nr:hypothetical protein [Bryobacteraceae bacterium]